jgi:hypothetical protein
MDVMGAVGWKTLGFVGKLFMESRLNDSHDGGRGRGTCAFAPVPAPPSDFDALAILTIED